MNSIALVPTIGRGALFIEDHEWGRVDHLDIQVDGKPLSNWLDELGPPIFMTPLGWGASRGKAHSYDVAQLLGEQPPDLESGRVPVLNYEGEYRGMVYSVRILVDGDQVRWTDWAYGGFDDQRPLVELNDLTDPGDFVFDRQTYEAVFQAVRETPPQAQRVQVEERGNTISIRITPSTALRVVLSFFLVVTLGGGIAAGLVKLLVQYPEDYAYRLEPLTNILFFTLIGLALILGILRLQAPGYLRRRATEIVIDRDAETLRIIKKGWGFGPPTSESIGFSEVKGIWFDRRGGSHLKFLPCLDLDRPDRNRTILPRLVEGDFVVLRGALERGLALKAHYES